jgi:hypothetical protein
MANERRRWFGEMLGVHMAWLASVEGKTFKQMPDPTQLNPYRDRERKPNKTPEQVEHENAAGWAALDCFFGGRPKKAKRKAKSNGAG